MGMILLVFLQFVGPVNVFLFYLFDQKSKYVRTLKIELTWKFMRTQHWTKNEVFH